MTKTYSFILFMVLVLGNLFIDSIMNNLNNYDSTKRSSGVENTEDPAGTRSVASQGSLAPAGLGQAPQPLMQ